MIDALLTAVDAVLMAVGAGLSAPRQRACEYQDLSSDPAIPLLGTHTEGTRAERDTCTPVFTAALFTLAGTWA